MEPLLNEVIDVDALQTEPEIEIPIPLTCAKTKPLTTLKIEYIDDLPDYPQTHLQGYSYIIASKGRSREECKLLLSEIQYSKRQICGRKESIFCSFLNCFVTRFTWNCSGIKTCEYLNSDLRLQHHTAVDEALWERLRKARETINLSEIDQSKRNAYSYFRMITQRFNWKHACTFDQASCKPVFKRYNQMNVLGEYPPYIACINDPGGQNPPHLRESIPNHTNMDLLFLERLFNEGLLPPAEECGVFEPVKSRRPRCDQDHPQGNGRLISTKCNVQFSALLPLQLQECPYLIFTSHGIHQHVPPPPNKPPEQILNGIQKIIRELRDPSLTTAQFLRSPQLESFCAKHHSLTLAEIHSSFSNKDRISAIIQKERLLSNPAGQGLNGLIFLRNQDPLMKEYIQEYYHDSNGSMALCAFKEQIQLLSTQGSFEVNMSYKRIRTKGFNEVLFSTFLTDQKKIVTLLRIFTNQETTEGYFYLFKRAFELIERITRKPVEFYPIHGSGIHGIIVDMDNKQYTGLGQYLSEIDPQNRDYTWQLQNIIVFCKVHFQRSILTAIGTQNHGTGLWSRMMSLIDCKSEEDYDELIRMLITLEDEKVRNWALHKKRPIIKAGLNKFCSKIQPIFFQSIRDHTNAVEQSHEKSYASGKCLSLTEAARNSAKLDKGDIEQYSHFNQYNIHHSSRTSSIETNYRRLYYRPRKRPRSSSQGSTNDFEEEPASQPVSRPRSQSSRRSRDTESVRSTTNLRRFASSNTLSAEQKRQELELKKLEADIRKQEADIRKQEEETRLQQLRNEELELNLIERRRQLQEETGSTL